VDIYKNMHKHSLRDFCSEREESVNTFYFK